MQTRPLNLEAIRFRLAGAGILAGMCVSLLVNMFIVFLMHNVRIPEDMPGILLYVIAILTPLIALSLVLMTVNRMFSQETPANKNQLFLDSVVYFGIPFISVYFLTWFLYWIFRV